MDLGRIAHQMAIVDTLGALAGPDIGQDLGQAAVDTTIDDRSRTMRALLFHPP
jgi:hypothetical protein